MIDKDVFQGCLIPHINTTEIHRITEFLRFGSDLLRLPSPLQLPLLKQGHLSEAVQNVSSQVLSISKSKESTATLGKCVLVFDHPYSKIFFFLMLR